MDPRKKYINWEPKYQTLLFELWEENFVGLRDLQRNSHIYARMAEALKEAGLQHAECSSVRYKIENLAKKYKQELKAQGVSGGAPSKWEHFERVHKILHQVKSIHNEEKVQESTDPFDACEEEVPWIVLDDSMSSSSMDRSSAERFSVERTSPGPSQRPAKRRKISSSSTMSAFEEAIVDGNKESLELMRSVQTSIQEMGNCIKETLSAINESLKKKNKQIKEI